MQSTTNDDIVVKLDVKVPMRDGVKLSTNIFLPNEDGCFPMILMRTPYGKGDADNTPTFSVPAFDTPRFSSCILFSLYYGQKLYIGVLANTLVKLHKPPIVKSPSIRPIANIISC